jgi:hypothetical protein
MLGRPKRFVRPRRVCDHPSAALTDAVGDVAWCRWCGPVDARTRAVLPGAGLERLADRLSQRILRRSPD